MVSVSQSIYLIPSHLFVLQWICLSCTVWYYFSFTYFCACLLFCSHFDIRFLDFLKCVFFLSHILPTEVIVNSYFQFYAPGITTLEQGELQEIFASCFLGSPCITMGNSMELHVILLDSRCCPFSTLHSTQSRDS